MCSMNIEHIERDMLRISVASHLVHYEEILCSVKTTFMLHTWNVYALLKRRRGNGKI